LLQHRPLLTVNTLQADISDDEGEGDSEHNYRSPTKSYHLDEFNSSFFAVSPSGSDKQTFQHTSNTTKALSAESMSRSCESQVDLPVVARAATPSGKHNSIKREETLYVTSPENVKLWYLDAEYKRECEVIQLTECFVINYYWCYRIPHVTPVINPASCFMLFDKIM